MTIINASLKCDDSVSNNVYANKQEESRINLFKVSDFNDVIEVRNRDVSSSISITTTQTSTKSKGITTKKFVTRHLSTTRKNSPKPILKISTVKLEKNKKNANMKDFLKLPTHSHSNTKHLHDKKENHVTLRSNANNVSKFANFSSSVTSRSVRDKTKKSELPRHVSEYNSLKRELRQLTEEFKQKCAYCRPSTFVDNLIESCLDSLDVSDLKTKYRRDNDRYRSNDENNEEDSEMFKHGKDISNDLLRNRKATKNDKLNKNKIEKILKADIYKRSKKPNERNIEKNKGKNNYQNLKDIIVYVEPDYGENLPLEPIVCDPLIQSKDLTDTNVTPTVIYARPSNGEVDHLAQSKNEPYFIKRKYSSRSNRFVPYSTLQNSNNGEDTYNEAYPFEREYRTKYIQKRHPICFIYRRNKRNMQGGRKQILKYNKRKYPTAIVQQNHRISRSSCTKEEEEYLQKVKKIMQDILKVEQIVFKINTGDLQAKETEEKHLRHVSQRMSIFSTQKPTYATKMIANITFPFTLNVVKKSSTEEDLIKLHKNILKEIEELNMTAYALSPNSKRKDVRQVTEMPYLEVSQRITPKFDFHFEYAPMLFEDELKKIGQSGYNKYDLNDPLEPQAAKKLKMVINCVHLRSDERDLSEVRLPYSFYIDRKSLKGYADDKLTISSRSCQSEPESTTKECASKSDPEEVQDRGKFIPTYTSKILNIKADNPTEKIIKSEKLPTPLEYSTAFTKRLDINSLLITNSVDGNHGNLIFHSRAIFNFTIHNKTDHPISSITTDQFEFPNAPITLPYKRKRNTVRESFAKKSNFAAKKVDVDFDNDYKEDFQQREFTPYLRSEDMYGKYFADINKVASSTLRIDKNLQPRSNQNRNYIMVTLKPFHRRINRRISLFNRKKKVKKERRISKANSTTNSNDNGDYIAVMFGNEKMFPSPTVTTSRRMHFKETTDPFMMNNNMSLLQLKKNVQSKDNESKKDPSSFPMSSYSKRSTSNSSITTKFNYRDKLFKGFDNYMDDSETETFESLTLTPLPENQWESHEIPILYQYPETESNSLITKNSIIREKTFEAKSVFTFPMDDPDFQKFQENSFIPTEVCFPQSIKDIELDTKLQFIRNGIKKPQLSQNKIRTQNNKKSSAMLTMNHENRRSDTANDIAKYTEPVPTNIIDNCQISMAPASVFKMALAKIAPKQNHLGPEQSKTYQDENVEVVIPKTETACLATTTQCQTTTKKNTSKCKTTTPSACTTSCKHKTTACSKLKATRTECFTKSSVHKNCTEHQLCKTTTLRCKHKKPKITTSTVSCKTTTASCTHKNITKSKLKICKPTTASPCTVKTTVNCKNTKTTILTTTPQCHVKTKTTNCNHKSTTVKCKLETTCATDLTTTTSSCTHKQLTKSKIDDCRVKTTKRCNRTKRTKSTTPPPCDDKTEVGNCDYENGIKSTTVNCKTTTTPLCGVKTTAPEIVTTTTIPLYDIKTKTDCNYENVTESKTDNCIDTTTTPCGTKTIKSCNRIEATELTTTLPRCEVKTKAGNCNNENVTKSTTINCKSTTAPSCGVETHTTIPGCSLKTTTPSCTHKNPSTSTAKDCESTTKSACEVKTTSKCKPLRTTTKYQSNKTIDGSTENYFLNSMTVINWDYLEPPKSNIQFKQNEKGEWPSFSTTQSTSKCEKKTTTKDHTQKCDSHPPTTTQFTESSNQINLKLTIVKSEMVNVLNSTKLALSYNLDKNNSSTRNTSNAMCQKSYVYNNLYQKPSSASSEIFLNSKPKETNTKTSFDNVNLMGVLRSVTESTNTAEKSTNLGTRSFCNQNKLKKPTENNLPCKHNITKSTTSKNCAQSTTSKMFYNEDKNIEFVKLLSEGSTCSSKVQTKITKRSFNSNSSEKTTEPCLKTKSTNATKKCQKLNTANRLKRKRRRFYYIDRNRKFAGLEDRHVEKNLEPELESVKRDTKSFNHWNYLQPTHFSKNQNKILEPLPVKSDIAKLAPK
ncbi:hypothetical protein FQA39_LY14520 [Lamprigera yunnana]|nr:hypothetical protein FQA39_LY14520 [Lamprigera yunnana]